MQQVIVEFTLLLKFMNFNVASALGVGVDTIGRFSLHREHKQGKALLLVL